MSSEISSRISPTSRSGPNGSWLPSHCSYRDCNGLLLPLGGSEPPGPRARGVLAEALGQVEPLQGELEGRGRALPALLGEVEALHDAAEARHTPELGEEVL